MMTRGVFNLSGVTVEKTRFEVLKAISEGGYIRWGELRSTSELVSWFAPHSTVCRVRGTRERKKKEICSWVTTVLHSSTLPQWYRPHSNEVEIILRPQVREIPPDTSPGPN
jgi:hypothetical protein